MFNKSFFAILGILAYIYAINWVYNHVNVWFALALFIGGVYFSLSKLLNDK